MWVVDFPKNSGTEMSEQSKSCSRQWKSAIRVMCATISFNMHSENRIYLLIESDSTARQLSSDSKEKHYRQQEVYIRQRSLTSSYSTHYRCHCLDYLLISRSFSAYRRLVL